MMKKIIYALVAAVTLGMTSCDQFDEASKAKPVQGQNLKISLWTKAGSSRAMDDGVTFGDMEITLENGNEGLNYSKKFTGAECIVENVVPGIYSINVRGTAYDADGSEIVLQANIIKQPLLSSVDMDDATAQPELSLEVKGAVIGKLVLSEIYYCGSSPWYFRDQFYEIANNSDEVQYLDGLHFAHLPIIDFDKVSPIWPEEDGDSYVYAERVWKFPGSGTDYPLQPGESCVVAQFAANHQSSTYNPNSPVDCSGAEFEFFMNSATLPDQPAENMLHVYYDGNSDMGSIPMYLTSVFGTGLMIFNVPEGADWDPVFDPDMQTKNLADAYSSIYAKVPVEYVVDAVECIRSASYYDAKNIPGIIDGGYVTVNGSYLGIGVTRKTVEGSNPVKYVDTNNSTLDFEVGVTPVLHRHSKAPAWSHVNN